MLVWVPSYSLIFNLNENNKYFMTAYPPCCVFSGHILDFFCSCSTTFLRRYFIFHGVYNSMVINITFDSIAHTIVCRLISPFSKIKYLLYSYLARLQKLKRLQRLPFSVIAMFMLIPPETDVLSYKWCFYWHDSAFKWHTGFWAFDLFSVSNRCRLIVILLLADSLTLQSEVWRVQ